MRAMKKRTILLIVILLFPPVLIIAQNRNQERLQTYKIAFFTRRLNLTPVEAERFWPLYNEYQAQRTEIQQQRIELNRMFNMELNSMSDEQMVAAGDKLIELEVKETELSVEFHQQLKGILPPIKVLRLYQAENQFRQQLLKELQERRQEIPR